jgi:hypothetical protein
MIFAEMGAGNYAPVQVDHHFAGPQTIGDGPGAILADASSRFVQREQTFGFGRETATSAEGGLPPSPYRTHEPMPATTEAPLPPKPPRQFPGNVQLPDMSQLYPEPPSLPVGPPRVPGAAPPVLPPPVPGTSVPAPAYTPPATFLPGLEKTSSNVKWAVIGGIAAIGIIGALVILRG